MSWFQVADGEVVEAAHMNAAVAQGVPPFIDAAARAAAIGAPYPGQLSFLSSTSEYERWDGAKWAPLLPAGTRAWQARRNVENTGSGTLNVMNVALGSLPAGALLLVLAAFVGSPTPTAGQLFIRPDASTNITALGGVDMSKPHAWTVVTTQTVVMPFVAVVNTAGTSTVGMRVDGPSWTVQADSTISVVRLV